MWLLIAALLGFVAVAAGAIGAHVLEPNLTPRELETWRTAAHYHLVHAVLLAAISVPGALLQGRSAIGARWCLLIGILLFSGTLYAYVLSRQTAFARVTPLGGVVLMAGWAAVAVAAAFRRQN